MSATPIELEIRQTWDGKPVEEAHWIRLTISVQASILRIDVDAPLYGDPAPSSAPGPTDRLWEFEVVELFICGTGSAYTEIELGPHGHHLVLQLKDIRSPSKSLIPIDYAAQKLGARWRASAQVPIGLLPDGPHRINATSIHGVGEKRTYLSLGVLPGPQPDFHQPSHFPVEASLT